MSVTLQECNYALPYAPICCCLPKWLPLTNGFTVPSDQQVTIVAIDNTKDKHTKQLDMTMPKSRSNTGGLISELHLAIGAKVMLTVD